MVTDKKLPSNPPGWNGNVYYPSGKVGVGECFGIALRPGIHFDYDCYFPKVAEIQPQPPLPSSDTVVRTEGRPKLTLTPKQLSFLTKKMTIREKAKAMGISTFSVHKYMHLKNKPEVATNV